MQVGFTMRLNRVVDYSAASTGASTTSATTVALSAAESTVSSTTAASTTFGSSSAVYRVSGLGGFAVTAGEEAYAESYSEHEN